jgi:hypothetical protein
VQYTTCRFYSIVFFRASKIFHLMETMDIEPNAFGLIPYISVLLLYDSANFVLDHLLFGFFPCIGVRPSSFRLSWESPIILLSKIIIFYLLIFFPTQTSYFALNHYLKSLIIKSPCILFTNDMYRTLIIQKQQLTFCHNHLSSTLTATQHIYISSRRC